MTVLKFNRKKPRSLNNSINNAANILAKMCFNPRSRYEASWPRQDFIVNYSNRDKECIRDIEQAYGSVMLRAFKENVGLPRNWRKKYSVDEVNRRIDVVEGYNARNQYFANPTSNKKLKCGPL